MRNRSLALVGFALHAPALVLLGYRFNRTTVVRNLLAGGATILATAVTYAVLPAGERLAPCLIAWFSGHFGWSAYLAWAVFTGRAGKLAR
jgi:hypothetical protein